MNKTPIDWVRNPDNTQGYTWNPITGCLNHDNGLCKGGGFPCYAYKLANGRLRSRYLGGKNICLREDVAGVDLDPFYPRLWEWRILEPRDSSRGRGIFVCNMGELFGNWIPDEWIRRVLKEIPICKDNRFYLLTKQPQNLIKWSPFPDNCWVGVTATNPKYFAEACYRLKRVEARIKFISLEPLLDFEPDPAVLTWGQWIYDWLCIGGINWLIIGSQTKPYKPPKIEWVQEIVEAADKAGIPVFLKNNLYKAINERIWDKVNICMLEEGIGELRLRQEMPK